MRVMVNRWTHGHHSPHLETLLSCQTHKKKKKKKVKHCCGTAPFVFFYEWKRRQHFPKICGPTCRMNVMLIVTQCFCFFFPEELTIQYNHNSLNLGLALNSHPLYGIKSMVRRLVRWELITTTAPTSLHWHECWSTTGPKPPLWCFTYPCECFNILCLFMWRVVWYAFLFWWTKAHNFFCFP